MKLNRQSHHILTQQRNIDMATSQEIAVYVWVCIRDKSMTLCYIVWWQLTCLFSDTISLSIALSITSPWLTRPGCGGSPGWGPVAMATRSSWLMYIPCGKRCLFLCSLPPGPRRPDWPHRGRIVPVRLPYHRRFKLSIDPLSQLSICR